MNPLINRILAQFSGDDPIDRLARLSQSDFNSFMLEVYRRRTDKLKPAEVLKQFADNRFAAPSGIDPVAYLRLETDILTMAKEANIQPVLLSPVAPLGNSSVYGTVDQNNVVSATRGTEVLADSTNMLATIVADRIKRGEVDNQDGVHLCSTDRLSRAQNYSGARSFAHFGLYGMVSSGKDRGSYQCEKELLAKQFAFYRGFFGTRFRAETSIMLYKRSGYPDSDGFFGRMFDFVSSRLPDIPISKIDADSENLYYKGLNFKIFATVDNETIEVGDGGFVDWTQRMLGNRKERCLISGIGLDRLLSIR